jgi:hypothetical protein
MPKQAQFISWLRRVRCWTECIATLNQGARVRERFHRCARRNVLSWGHHIVLGWDSIMYWDADSVVCLHFAPKRCTLHPSYVTLHPSHCTLHPAVWVHPVHCSYRTSLSRNLMLHFDPLSLTLVLHAYPLFWSYILILYPLSYILIPDPYSLSCILIPYPWCSSYIFIVHIYPLSLIPDSLSNILILHPHLTSLSFG